MKKQLSACLIVAATMFAICAEPLRAADTPEELWKEVAEANSKGRPKSAIAAVDKILELSKESNNAPQYTKALATKFALTAQVEGEKAEEKINRLQKVIPTAPAETQAVLKTILAHWYWQFYQQNRWRYMQRTHTQEAPGTDILAWDLPRILAEIDTHFTAALKENKELKSIPVGDWSALLENGNMPDSYRPTLFDFLAYEALSFYAYPDHGLAQGKEHFELPADSPILGDTADFLAWTPQTDDTNSPIIKAIKLYQELLRFHADDSNRDAFLDADLARLHFGSEKGYGDSDKELYAARLQTFIETHADHSLSALARSYLARKIRSDGNLVDAHAIAKSGLDAFPNSIHSAACFNIVTQIEAKHLRVEAERVWNTAAPEIVVQYGNISEVSFRLVKLDWNALLKRDNWNPEQFNDQERDKLLERDVVLQWKEGLEPTPDYKHRAALLSPPKNVPAGFYCLLASPAENFTKKDNIILCTPVWVSELALITRAQYSQNEISGFVLAADEGTPVIGATVTSWYRDNNGHWQKEASTTTDTNGQFRVSGKEHRYHWLHVRHGDQEVTTQAHVYSYSHGRRTISDQRVTLFSDRAIYRPGQMIHFKGIVLFFDQEKNIYEARKNRRVAVIFRDVNRDEIARKEFTSNSYGSFSGTFTAPRDRLMGRMFLETGEGNTYFQVEEYKRPKFKVSLDLPEESPRLNDEVTVKGKALTYSGAPIDNAEVTYRVVRRVRFPYWYWSYYWWHPRGNSEEREIANGRARTDASGAFVVNFTALPDKEINPETEPIFSYEISADITDSAGETRSAVHSVQIGYTALQATLTSGEWNPGDKETSLTVRTASIAGVGEGAECKIALHALVEPERIHRARLQQLRYWWTAVQGKPPADKSDPTTWELGKVLKTRSLETDAAGNGSVQIKLKPGAYRAALTSRDRFGKPVKAFADITVVDPKAKRLKTKVPFMLRSPSWSVEPGEEMEVLWGSGYDAARAFVELEHRGKIIRKYWTDRQRTQQILTQTVTESLRGGFTLHVSMVRENRAYLNSRHINVPWSNKRLSLKWEHITSKLKPAQEETWTAVVSGPDAKRVSAEFVATLYDASLDAFVKHNWPSAFNVFYTDSSTYQAQFQNSMRGLYRIAGGWGRGHRSELRHYRRFPQNIQHGRPRWYREEELRRGRGRRGEVIAYNMAAPGAPATHTMALASKDMVDYDLDKVSAKTKSDGRASEVSPAKPNTTGTTPDLDGVTARANLNETAFFMPHLVADEDGVIRMTFSMPEALTTWRFMGFAHDAALRTGYLEGTTVTSKELMLQPNAPRFLREGDILYFTTKVLNQSPTVQKGIVRLQLFDAATDKPLDAEFGNAENTQKFDIPAAASRAFSWKLAVPDGARVLRYKVVGASDRLSDGEEGYIPVLSNRRLVIESLPLPIRGPAKKSFSFAKLLQSGKSKTLKHERLTAQMVSNPSWYAIMALPYLMEYPHECTEQAFNRLYANSVAQYIANSNPRIRRIFDQWRDTPTLDSPLEKNEDLKSVILQETPWLADGENESQARRQVGILFDANTVRQNLASAQRKVASRQRSDGAWSWFPGGPANIYITMYVMTGYGRLQHLGVDGVDVKPAHKAARFLDGWAQERYDWLKRRDLLHEENLTSEIAFYLYGRSFFLSDVAIHKSHKVAVDYFLGEAEAHWLKLHSRQSKAHVALALKRFNRPGEAANDIVISIREHSVSNEEMGMFWRDTEHSYWWYHAPIETQAMMIELFDEVANDQKSVEESKVWLLKQKQTQNWKTTKATADAVYGLLLRGTDLLADTSLVSLSLGGEVIKPENVEAGTGFYEKIFAAGEIRPEQGRIEVEKTTAGVAWGSVHWQYLEDISKITPYEGTPLTLKKGVFIKKHTDNGPELISVSKRAPQIGDELVVRIELRSDRDMEYLHMKDQRGSGTEPVNVLSRYKYQDGLAYYESTRDTATHFFIDYLPKGTYVFEYSLRVFHKGTYPTGLTEIQCMYAPEFNSHSASEMLKIK